MNRIMLRLAMGAATGAYNMYRNSDSKQQRKTYDALLGALKDGKLGDLAEELGIDDLEELHGAARANAGDLTRDAHDRLDRRRAAFAAAAPDRKARREALKHAAKQQEKDNRGGGVGKFIGISLGIAGAAAAAWAAWEFWLSDMVNGGSGKQATKTTRPAPTRTETDEKGNSTLVYSTTTETAGTASGARATNDPDNDMRPKADMHGSAGPLGEEPAERDEELLTSIDEQLTTLDTLEDSQREVTEPRHAKSDVKSDVLRDTGSGNRSDKTSDADTTIGASGRHELRKDNDAKR